MATAIEFPWWVRKIRAYLDVTYPIRTSKDRNLIFPPEVDQNLGKRVSWQEMQQWLEFLIPSFKGATFTFDDSEYIIYPKDVTLKAIADAPKPLKVYVKNAFDCDDFAEWRKLILKQILVSCPIIYCEGVIPPNQGHAWILVPHSDGVEYLGIQKQTHWNAEKIYLVRI